MQATWERCAKGHRVVFTSAQTTRTTTVRYDALSQRGATALLRWRCNVIPASDVIREQDLEGCSCGRGPRSRDHLLLHCTLLEGQRQRVQSFFSPSESNDISRLLLGGVWKGERRQQYLDALEEWVLAAARLRYPNEQHTRTETAALQAVVAQLQFEDRELGASSPDSVISSFGHGGTPEYISSPSIWYNSDGKDEDVSEEEEEW